MDVLADLAGKLGLSAESANWKKRSDALLTSLVKEYWNGSVFGVSRAFGKTTFKSTSLFVYLPLILGDRLPKDIAKKMAEDLQSRGFLTPWGLATEQPSSPLYKPDSYWRGPVWAPPVYLISDGLQRAGYSNLADTIIRHFCNAVKVNGMAENFDALTGNSLRDPSYTWTSSTFLILAHELNKK
jgi:glycogen debranching enzyme